MDLRKLLSKYSRTSCNTNQESINTPVEVSSEATQSNALVGELKMESTIGYWPTLGDPHGA